MAISLLFGVFVSTLLTLVVVPLGCVSLGERMFQCAGVGDPSICAEDEEQPAKDKSHPGDSNSD
jgi:hypothetical protein